ncbi:hypothetical protein MP228_003017 [Amoeboaphelidium protococcarum]|nr:hypothetical protein MP228_003017 [Amoeboaphelidium protococcarum]
MHRQDGNGYNYDHDDDDFDDAGEETRMVPYSQEWRVILRRQSSQQAVLINQESHEISVVRQSPAADHHLLPAVDSHSQYCSLCGQSLPQSSGNHQVQDYVDRNYFQLLSAAYQQQSNIPPLHLFPDNRRSFHQNADGQNQHVPYSALNQGYYSRFFKEIERLGRGSGGSVYLCQHILDNVLLGDYVVKKIAVGDNHKWLERMLREVLILERAKHPNVIEYKHCWLEEHKMSSFGPSVPCLFVLMELANGGNLESYVLSHIGEGGDLIHGSEKPRRSSQKPPTYMRYEHIWSFFLDICSGLAHLHSQGVLHRDLKPQNLLLKFNNTQSRGELPRVLISDFGECESLFQSHGPASYQQSDHIQRTGQTGTIEFCAPELLKTDDRGRFYVEYSPACDIWSLGMVLCFMIYGRLPYKSIDDFDQLKREMLNVRGTGKVLKLPQNRSDVPLELIELMRKLLSINPGGRPTAFDLVIGYSQFRSYVYKTGNRRRLESGTENDASFNQDSISQSEIVVPQLKKAPVQRAVKSRSPAATEEITTIFVIGFPEDLQEREFQNLFTFAPGYEAATLKYPQPQSDDCSSRKQIIGFAKFATREEALNARNILNGKKIDSERGHVLKSEMAKKNLHTKRAQNYHELSGYPSSYPGKPGYFQTGHLGYHNHHHNHHQFGGSHHQSTVHHTHHQPHLVNHNHNHVQQNSMDCPNNAADGHYQDGGRYDANAFFNQDHGLLLRNFDELDYNTPLDFGLDFLYLNDGEDLSIRDKVEKQQDQHMISTSTAQPMEIPNAAISTQNDIVSPLSNDFMVDSSQNQRIRKFNCFSGIDPLSRSCISDVIHDEVLSPSSIQYQLHPLFTAGPLSPSYGLQSGATAGAPLSGQSSTSSGDSGSCTPPSNFGVDSANQSCAQSSNWSQLLGASFPPVLSPTIICKGLSQYQSFDQTVTSHSDDQVYGDVNSYQSQPLMTGPETVVGKQSKILCVRNIPHGIELKDLVDLFSTFDGFKDLQCRTKSGNIMRCMVDFESVECAASAMHSLQSGSNENSLQGSLKIEFQGFSQKP